MIDVSGAVPCPNLMIDPASLSGLFAFPATVVDGDGSLGCYTDRLCRHFGMQAVDDDDFHKQVPIFGCQTGVFMDVHPGRSETSGVGTTSFGPEARMNNLLEKAQPTAMVAPVRSPADGYNDPLKRNRSPSWQP